MLYFKKPKKVGTKEMDLEAVRKEIEKKGLKNFIKEELKKRGITSIKLAKELGVSKQTVLDTINCKVYKTSSNVFKAIDRKLGLPEGFLYSEHRKANMLFWIKKHKKERLLKAMKRQKRREKMLQKKSQQQGGNHENS